MVWRKSFLFFFLSFVMLSQAFPTTEDSHVVVVDSTKADKATTETTKPEVEDLKPKILSMDIETNVTTRYASTLVTSKVANPNKKAKEVTFSIIIPETAFISKFSMELDGKVYDAYVKEKEEAKKIYDDAVFSGIGAAHVQLQARDSNHFTVSVNVEPMSKAIFRLTYEEFLSRKLGYYNIIMNINPRQLLDHLNVKVNINETLPISSLLVPSMKSANEIDVDLTDSHNLYATEWISDDKLSAQVSFSPNKEQQKELMKIFKQKEVATTPASYLGVVPESSVEDEGLNGQFVVHYDVNRTQNGEILLNDGYFVHFFAPENLKPLKKHVIFVLDVSGSMIGHKIVQLKEAMKSILDDLDKDDYFNILDFSYGVKAYNLQNRSMDAIYRTSSGDYYYDELPKTYKLPEVPPPPSKASKENVEQAKNIIEELDANGGTNIYDALTTALKVSNHALKMSSQKESKDQQPEPMIIFLTDGDATVGEIDPQKIMNAVKESNNNRTAIFSLAFGEDADRNFLKKVSLQNKGFLRHIYEAADAADQLKDFYKQISLPLLSNITYSYPKNQIEEDSVVKSDEGTYFCGSELVMIGKIIDTGKFNDGIVINGNGHNGPIDFIPHLPTEVKRKTFYPLERMWAFRKIQKLLDNKDALDSQSSDSAKELSDKVLKIALKYSFVTPVTSLVVVKPNASSAVNAEEAGANRESAGVYQSFYQSALPLSLSGASFQSGPISASALSSSDVVDSQMSLSAPPVAIAYLNHPSAQQSDTIDRFDSVGYGGTASYAAAALPMPGPPGLVGPPAPPPTYQPQRYPIYHTTTTHHATFPAFDNAESVPDMDEVYEEAVIPTEKKVQGNNTDVLAKYRLEKYPWVAEYINETTDTLNLPGADGSSLSYKLITTQDHRDFNDKLPCLNAFGGVNGTCTYLSECQELDRTFLDLSTYLKYNCNAENYAGVCCSSVVP